MDIKIVAAIAIIAIVAGVTLGLLTCFIRYLEIKRKSF